MGEYPSIEFAPHAPGHVAFPKIARLNRDIVITEKIDGTNAAIGIVELPQSEEGSVMYEVYAQSRNRIITPGKGDHAGFAAWVESITLPCGKPPKMPWQPISASQRTLAGPISCGE